ncbi:MAG: FeoA family protein [Dehalococcoidales bacterium]|nr:FeoA family protein [Dehalococcoidales bacterium]
MLRFRQRNSSLNDRSIDGVLPLTRLANGQYATVTAIGGGDNIAARLSSLGIRQGQKLTRIGGMFFQGPVTVRLNKGQVAIGFRMAEKILVKIEK